MIVATMKDRAGIIASGKITREVLSALVGQIGPGRTTGWLNEEAERLLQLAKATSAILEYGFPASICVSINNEVAHGLPGSRVIREGDIVTVDLAVRYCGYVTDAAETVVVPPVFAEPGRLVSETKEALMVGISAIRLDVPVYEIGEAIQAFASDNGLNVVPYCAGHGVGKKLHEWPNVPNFKDMRCRAHVREGMVFTIEPVLTVGDGRVVVQDGVIRTLDGRDSAHFEHTLMICDKEIIVVC